MSKSMIRAAKGEIPADLVLKNGNVLNVFSEEIVPCDVAIVDGRIVGLGSYEGEREIDCTGKYIAPGLIDAHVHIESSMVSPLEFTRYIIRKGTTGIVADPHEIVNVCGKRGMEYILDASDHVPADVYVMVPSSVPATNIDTNGAGKFLAEDMAEYKSHPRVLGLGEMMRFVDVLNEDPETLDKLHAFSEMVMDGHAPGISQKEIQAYRMAGIQDDHECSSGEEALEKLRAGFHILVREGSGAKNLESILGGLLKNGASLDRCMFCTDDKHLEDIEKDGHINYCVRKAIALGVPEVRAYKMASWNAARFYGLKENGAVGPGYRADLLIIDDLKEAVPSMVLKDGRIVDEAWLDSFAYELKDRSLLRTVRIRSMSEEDLLLVKKEKNHVLELVPNELLTLHREEEVPGRHGVFIPDQDYAKLAVVERYGKNGKVGVCPVKGYGIRSGAIATTISHDSHNIIAAGDNDRDILCAVRELERIQGGYVIASGEKVVDELPLSIGGLMSVGHAEDVQKKTGEMVQKARNMGVSEGVDPFITLSFMALTVIPELRLTEAGMFDVTTMQFIKE